MRLDLLERDHFPVPGYFRSHLESEVTYKLTKKASVQYTHISIVNQNLRDNAIVHSPRDFCFHRLSHNNMEFFASL